MDCLNCGTKISKKKKFCNITCQKEYQYNEYVKAWKKGEKDGLRGEYQISMYLKSYLLKNMITDVQNVDGERKTYIQIPYHLKLSI